MDRNAQPDIHRTEQGVLNRSFDETYQVLAVEQLVHNPITGNLDRMTQPGDATEVLEEIEHAIQSIAAARGIAGDLRVTIVGGGVTISSGTVTTVTTVTGITNIGGIPAAQLVPSNQNIAAVLTNINNVGA